MTRVTRSASIECADIFVASRRTANIVSDSCILFANFLAASLFLYSGISELTSHSFLPPGQDTYNEDAQQANYREHGGG